MTSANYYDDMEFRELLRLFIGSAAGLMNPDNSHLSEDGNYYLMPSGLVEEFSGSLDSIIGKVFEDAKKARKEQERQSEQQEAEIEVEVCSETPIEAPKDYIIPENVARTLGQFKGWGVDLNDFEEVSKKLRDFGDIDVLDWVYRNPVAYSWFVKKKAW